MHKVNLIGEDNKLKGNIDIIIEGNSITSITNSDCPDLNKDDLIVDAQSLLAIPGLVNSHTHSPENFFKGNSELLQFELWVEHMIHTCFPFTPRDTYLSALLGAIEMLKTGTTACLDHIWFTPKPNMDTLDSAMQAYRDIGIRATIAPIIDDEDHVIRYAKEFGYDLSSFREDLPMPVMEKLSLIRDFIDKWHNLDGKRLKCFSGLSGIQWSSDYLLEEAFSIGKKYPGSGVHIHVDETKLQRAVSIKRFGVSGLQYLYANDLLGQHVSCAHTVWVDDYDIDILAATGAKSVHNPASNLKLGSGIAPVKKMLNKGVIVGLGTDGSCSSDNQVMFDAIKLTSLIHNVGKDDEKQWVSAHDALKMATEMGALIVSPDQKLGTIEQGQVADLTLLNLNSLSFIPLRDPVKQIAYCETGSAVHTVIVDGRIIVQNGRILTIDEDAILTEIKERFSNQTLFECDRGALQQRINLIGAFLGEVNKKL